MGFIKDKSRALDPRPPHVFVPFESSKGDIKMYCSACGYWKSDLKNLKNCSGGSK